MNKCEINSGVFGIVETNVWLLTNKETSEALIIDPADDAAGIIRLCDRTNSIPVAILLTHGHFDHMLAAPQLAKELEIPIYAYSGENVLMRDVYANCSVHVGLEMTCTADREVTEGQMLKLAGFKIKVLHTPGHTAGSCCYYLPEEGILVSGDTLFRGSFGRTDLETGSDAAIVRSVRRLLREIPEDTVVLPGHMGKTTIAFEKKYNPLSETASW